MRRWLVVSGLLATAMIAGITLPGRASTARPAAARMRLDVVAHWGGPSEAVAAAGPWALLGEGQRVLVLDVRDPAAPRLVGRSNELGGVVTRLSFAGRRAVVATGGAGLHVMDVSLPFAPTDLGRWDGGEVRDVEALGNRAYVLDNSGRLVILDISDPTAIRALGRSVVDGFREVAVSGGIAWLAARRDQVVGVDVRDPARPRLLAEVNIDSYLGGLSAGEGWMVIGYSDTVNVYDVQDPGAPRLLGSLKVGYGVTRSVVAERKVYLARGPNPILVLDIRAGLLTEAARVDHEGAASDIAADDGRVYFAVSPQPYAIDPPVTGLGIVRGAQRVGTFAGLGSARGIAVRDGLAYVAAGPYGVEIWDLSHLPQIGEAGRLRTTGEATGLTIDGQTMYVADDGAGLVVADLALPAAPRVVAHAGSGSYSRVRVFQGRAYVIRAGALGVIDVRTPFAPGTERPLKPAANDVDVDATAVYVAGWPELAILPFDGAGQPGSVTPVAFGTRSFGGLAVRALGDGVALMHRVDRCQQPTPQAGGAIVRPVDDPDPLAPAITATVTPSPSPTPECPRLAVVRRATPGPGLPITGADPNRPITILSHGDHLVANVNGITGWALDDATGPQAVVAAPIPAVDLTTSGDLLFAAAGLDGLYVLRLVPADATTSTPTPRRSSPRPDTLWLPWCQGRIP